ncbi:MAG: hypothetical protein GF320_22135 [Armatimonadia bacterium]|nr:hypothetical protein [Armatimonadia bacterium]
MNEQQRQACAEAMAELRAERPEDVPRQLIPLIREDPELGEACELVGIAFARLSQDDKALQAFQRAASLPDAPPTAHHNLGVMHLRLGDQQAAQAAFEAAVAHEDALGESQRGLAAAQHGRPVEERPLELEEGDAPPVLPTDEEPSKGVTRGAGDPRLSVRGVVLVIPFLMPTLPPPPKVPAPREDAFDKPLTPGLCLGVAWDGVKAHAGQAAWVALVFLVIVSAMYGLDWVVSTVLKAIGFGFGLAMIRAVLLVFLLLFSAGMALVGIMIADTQLYRMNQPSLDDLWGGFSDWGMVAGTGYIKLLILLPAILVAYGLASVPDAPWLGLVGLPVLLGLMYYTTRLWFPVHLMMSTESEITDAFKESWLLTRDVWKPLYWLQLIVVLLTAVPVVPVVIVRSISCSTGVAVGAHLLAVALAVFLLPLAAAASGAAYRLTFVREYPGSTPFNWVRPEDEPEA